MVRRKFLTSLRRASLVAGSFLTLRWQVALFSFVHLIIVDLMMVNDRACCNADHFESEWLRIKNAANNFAYIVRISLTNSSVVTLLAASFLQCRFTDVGPGSAGAPKG